MKKLFLLLTFSILTTIFLTPSSSFAQGVLADPIHNRLDLFEFDESTNLIKGHPYYYKEWNEATLYLDNASTLKVKFLRIDANQHMIVVKKNEHSKPYFAKKDMIEKIVIHHVSGSNYTFLKLGKELVEKADNDAFYLTLDDTNLHLVKYVHKKFKKYKEIGPNPSGRGYDEYLETSNYYLLGPDNIYHPVRKLKNKHIAKVLDQENYKRLLKYLKKHKIDLDSERQVLNFIESEHMENYKSM